MVQLNEQRIDETFTYTPLEQGRNQEKKEVSSLTALEAYISDFGYSPRNNELPSYSYPVFYIAQKLERYIKDLKISIAVKPDQQGKKQLIEREIDVQRPRTTYTEGEKIVDFPANTMDLTTIEGIPEIPEVIPTEWLLEEINPDEFYHRAANQQLLKPEWKEADQTPKTSYEAVKEKELVEIPAPPTKKKQHAYVLRDVSGSTMYADDNRYVVIQALALAFLRQGYLQGSQLAIRDFTEDVGPLHAGKSQEDLRRIATLLLSSDTGGGTDIQRALQAAVHDIKKDGKFQRADILLLTDGESELGQNPLGDIKLHTFILGSDSYNAELRQWSASFKRSTKLIRPNANPIGEFQLCHE